MVDENVRKSSNCLVMMIMDDFQIKAGVFVNGHVAEADHRFFRLRAESIQSNEIRDRLPGELN